MRRPLWLWILIGLYALIGVSQLAYVVSGLFRGASAGPDPGVAVLSVLVGAAATLTAIWTWQGDRRAVLSALLFLGFFAAAVLWGTAVMGYPTRWAAMLGWFVLFATMAQFLRIAQQRGHLS